MAGGAVPVPVVSPGAVRGRLSVPALASRPPPAEKSPPPEAGADLAAASGAGPADGSLHRCRSSVVDRAIGGVPILLRH